MERGDRQWAEKMFPFEMMPGFEAVFEKLKSSDWTRPDDSARALFTELAKYDYQAIYSKFMATCIMYWLSPEEIRKRGLGTPEERLEISPKTERTFEVLWLAYERWVARGLGHYVEVATALSKFYSQVRWGMAIKQTADSTDVEKDIAKEAYYYLLQVQSLVDQSYELFKLEMEPMLRNLIEINPEIANIESDREKSQSS